MKKFHSNSMKALAFSASAIAFVMAGPVSAQDEGGDGQEEDDEQVDVSQDGQDSSSGDDGGITVTGSRIKRDTYTSISPLQVINTEQSREVGLFDPSQILQRSESASGQQIDATFNGFVLDNGPGSATINLRGLGADRTLLLLNGRRLAPAGVEGAPTNPSINLLPGSLIDRYEIVTDGASSVYGSDAVAGVVNVILQKDFDGLELFGRGEINPQGAGEDFTVSASWGTNTDRAFIGVGVEYDYRDAIRLRDRDFFEGCTTNYELTNTGEIRTLGIAVDARSLRDSNGAIGVVPDDCRQFVGTGALVIRNSFAGAIFRQPGAGNYGLPGFSETRNAFGNVVDSDGDGVRDVDFSFNNLDGRNPDQVFLSEQKLLNAMAYGEYVFPGEANLTAFFEANYSRAEVGADFTGNSQLSPAAPANNQFNPCNPIAANGVSCGATDDAFNGLPPGFTDGFFGVAPGSAREVRSFFSIRGDRDNFEVVQEQYRGVLGVKGDLPFISPSWTFELSGTFTRSEGRSSRVGVRSDRLALALGYDPTVDGGVELRAFGNTPLPGGACDTANLSNPANAQPDLTAGCVPVNIFADSVFGVPFGSFETAAETEYLLDSRDFDTTYEQLLLSAFATGDLFDLQGGPVSAVVGVEWREDSINSLPDAVASEGLLFGFFSDQGAVGSKHLLEAFGELSLPLVAAKPWVEELFVDVAGRVTEEEFYGTNFTYSIKGGWRPVQPLLFRFTYGTSFRAPNLRENFLLGQTGFLFRTDPCAVPDDAFQPLNGGYQAGLDERDPAILANCIREGRDPTRVGVAPNGGDTDQSQSVEIRSGGSLDIDPETSRSVTAGFSYEETVGDGLDVALGFTYFDIKLKDSIVEPNSQFIINDCFLRTDGTRSPFCDRITYDTDAANTRLLVSELDSGFINLNSESVRGMDFNVNLGHEFQAFGSIVDLGLNVRANHLIERSTTFIDELGNASFDEDVGEFGFPKWTGTATFTADIDDFRFTWQTRYQGRVEQQTEDIDPLSDAFGNGPDGAATGFFGDTCTGGGSANAVVAGDGVFCRDIGFAEEQFFHAASIRWDTPSYTLTLGVDNIFNTAPPLVDPNEFPGVAIIANNPIGNGYDYDGREFFGAVTVRF